MNSLSQEDARLVVQEAGLRATAPRIAVLRLLSCAEKPMSHSEVVEAIGTTYWDQATLYRNLVRLVEAGLARVAIKVAGVTRYEARAADDDEPHLHPHFACRICGEVSCLPEARLEGTLDRRWREAIAKSELELTGDCPDCLEKTSDKRVARGSRRRSGRAQ